MLAAPRPTRTRFRSFDEDTRATTFYTTGTTGLPKGVYYSHRQLVLHTMAREPGAGARAACDVRARATSTCRSRRCSMCTPGACRTWRRCWASSRSTRAATCRTCCSASSPARGVTFSHCVPTILQMMLGSPARRQTSTSRRGRSSSAARRCRVPLARAAVERGIDIIAGYGMSETCPILTLAHLVPAHARLGCRAEPAVPLQGRAADSVRAAAHRRRRHERRRARRGEPGRDRRARAVAHAGLSRRARALRGAVARRLAAHRRRRHHRRRRLPQDRRPHQGRREDRRRMGVVARPRGHHPARCPASPKLPSSACRTRSGASVRSRSSWSKAGGVSPTEDAIRRHVRNYAERGEISKYAVPDRVHFVDAIPKTSVGKLDKKVIRANLAAATPAAAAETAH